MKPKRLNVIYEGDCKTCLSNKDVFPNNSVDLIITSPPYANKRKKSYGGIRPDDYVEWFLPIAKQLKRILKRKGSFILNIKEHPINGERHTYVIELILELKKQGWRWVEEYCWYKKNSFPGKWSNRFRDSWERCLHFTKHKDFKMYQDAVKIPIGDWTNKRFKTMNKNDFIRYSSGNNKHLSKRVANWLKKKKVYPHNVVIFEDEHFTKSPLNIIELPVERTRNHSAAFPIELPSWFIKLFTRKGNVILDPFIGSGTTALSCILLDRHFIGIEIVEDYLDEIEKNIKNLEVDIKKDSGYQIIRK